ncbi:hypothetical protein [Nannocystis sp.]|uniref:hypothetical protein n=1 Tax=Nannocystis sp. TaxID=1962667 RepID=UPI0025F169C3|nr:hypothetical protein [Nannocystis sp.]MBK7829024.1 hypothetical protein [Nannocystis sp.]
MSGSGAVRGVIAGGALFACAPTAPIAAPVAVRTVESAGPGVPAAPAAADPGPALQARVCGERSPCEVRRARAAGQDPAGRTLTVLSVDLGSRSPRSDAPAEVATTDDGFAEEGSQDSFWPGASGRCREIEYWLVVGEQRAPEAVQQLFSVCNDGNGAAGLGEDTVTIGDDSLEHASSGGSNWRWSSTRRFELAPLRLRERSGDGSFVFGPNVERRSWSFDRFAGEVSWYSPPCDRATGEPSEVAEGSQVELTYSLIPAVAIDAAFTGGGWKEAGLGGCALALKDGSPGGPNDAAMRVVAAAGEAATTLLIEVEDDQLTPGDQLELWLAEPALNYMDHCLGDTAGGLRQWSIGVVDGRVLAGHGRPEPAALAVERAAQGLRLRLTPRGSFAALTLVYVDRDANERSARRLATSPLVPGRRETLGGLQAIEPEAASCAVIAGRLEPVLHALAGPGPVLR